MAEGAIEGHAADYKMPSKFATSFKFSRFDADTAAPRDTSKLSGFKKVAAKSLHVGASPDLEDNFVNVASQTTTQMRSARKLRAAHRPDADH